MNEQEWRLKTIKELLNEFSNAYFDADGNLHCDEWASKIRVNHLHKFGKSFKDANFILCEEWYIDGVIKD